MNLRILKKLSKRAAPYLPLIGDMREQFRSGPGRNYHGYLIRERKHAERVSSCHDEPISSDMLLITRPRSRAGTRHPYVKLYPPSHPRKGTIMVGATSGYYEPEWDEECAFAALSVQVYGHFTDWEACKSIDDVPGLTRDLSTVSKLFAAADDMIQERLGR